MENRFRAAPRNKVPISTWSPWKPVAIKNDEPKIESEKLKDASQYSQACSRVK